MEKPWFRRRRGLLSRDLGWGYVPISREGWLATFIFISVVFFLAHAKLQEGLAGFFTYFALVLFLFIVVCERTVQQN